MPSQAAFETADNEVRGVVKIEGGCGGSPDRCFANHVYPSPSEMPFPGFFAGVEECHLLAGFRIFGVLLRALPQRTMDAGKGKVFQKSRPAGDLRDDVVDVEGRSLTCRRKKAILATVYRALGYRPPQFCRNAHESIRLWLT